MAPFQKLIRIFITTFLSFSWLLISPTDANSDDPLVLGAQEIQKLNNSVQDLVYQDNFKQLISIAEDQYNKAVAAKSLMVDKSIAYNSALDAEAVALSELNSAQLAVDNQTSIVDSALINKNNAQNALDIANINLSNTPVPTSGIQGVAFRIYPLIRNGSTAVLPPNPGLICQGSLPYFYTYAGDGAICGASQNIIGIFNATLTIPENINDVYFAAYTDDGSRIYVNGVLEASQWQEQGGTWGPYTRHFDVSTNKTLNLEVWWYNGGGPGIMTIGWGHSGIWTGIPTEYLSYGQGSSQEVIDAYNQAVAAQQTAQTTYNDKLNIYNIENNKLTQYNQTLIDKQSAYQTAQDNTALALSIKNNQIDAYNESIIIMNNAINDAWKYYNAQKEREIQIAIAQAAANQPTAQPSIEPTPIPSPEPSVEPTPEQTKPSDPTPEPTPEITPEVTPTPDPTPEPSVEPTPEPSPQPTDIKPSPTSQPSPDPVVIPDKTINSPIDAQTANLIADLTNSNTLTKLTPEQKAAVAQVLGIKTEDINKVTELAKSDPAIATALQEFGDRANANLDAPMPYTLADAATEIQTEAFLSDPLGAVFNVDPLELLSNFSELGMDMTDDQREKAQEVIIPVVLVSNIVSAVIGMRR